MILHQPQLEEKLKRCEKERDAWRQIVRDNCEEDTEFREAAGSWDASSADGVEAHTAILQRVLKALEQAIAWRRWTMDKPTKRGFYRVRYVLQDELVERVTEVALCPFVSSRPTDLWCPLGWVDELSMEWAGPIPEGVEG